MYDYLVNINDSVIEVLKRLDKLSTTQTVFIINDNNVVVGTVTDGDVRRALINGYKLDDPLTNFCIKNFKYLKEGESNFSRIREFRRLKLKAVPLLNDKGELIKVYDFSILKSILPVDAVIMAGGKGERLKPLTNDVPKPLLKIGGKEIISYNFDRLFRYGITNQYITVNYLKNDIINFCHNYNSEIKFNLIEEEKFQGTAGSLSLIKEFKNDVILLMNSDLLTNIDYEDLYKTFIEKNADMMVASIPYHVNLPYAIFETDERKIISFKEKPNYIYYANAGIYLFKKEFIRFVPTERVYNATDLMEDIVKKGYNLLHYPIRSYWLDIGKHEDFEQAQKDIIHIDFD